MLDFVVQLTRDATRISRSDHERLRSVGFDDKGILQITLIAHHSIAATKNISLSVMKSVP